MTRIGVLGDLLIVDEDLWHSKLRDRHHTRRLAEIVTGPELAGPEQSVEEASNNPTMDFLLNALQPGATSEIFFKSEALVVRDDVVVREDHEAGGEIDAAVVISRDHDFLEENFHLLPSAANLGYVDGIEAFVESSQVNAMHDSCWRIHTPRIHRTVFNDTMDRVLAIVDVHLKDTRKFLFPLIHVIFW